jgi:hypothetical protein
LGAHSALQEFRQKLVKVKEKLFTDSAKEIARQRQSIYGQLF